MGDPWQNLLEERIAQCLHGEGAAVALARTLRPSRHKYDMGHLLLIAGSAGMTGAMVLAARAAARSGCGLVTVAHPAGGDTQLNVAVPTVMTRVMDWRAPLESVGPLSRYTALAVGPGIGRAPLRAEGVRRFLSCENLPPLALDADALWAVSPEGNGGRPFDFGSVRGALALTPHLGEFRRLFPDSSADESQVDAAAQRFGASRDRLLVLKQAATRIYTGGRCVVHSAPNGGLASGGSGDVLLGVFGGFMAWMPSMELAALSAVLAHSVAGAAARAELGELAMNPSDVADRLDVGVRRVETLIRESLPV